MNGFQAEPSEQLNSFTASRRQAALLELLDKHPGQGRERKWVNMHLHSFFSYNGEGWSPSGLAWQAYRLGLYAIGLCDFDTLAGVREIIEAGDLLRLRTMASFESRVFFPEYADQVINSPGEPGVFYFMGSGFVEPPAPGSRVGRTLADMQEQSHQRNQLMIERINQGLPGLELDYETEVLPLTPAGNPTERHIVRAYFDKVLLHHQGNQEAAANWWARQLEGKTGLRQPAIHELNPFLDYLRNKLMKQGGLGYQSPDPDSFPPLERVIRMILDGRAVPVSAWLDGSSSGESNPQKQLECLLDKGVSAVSIIPDRNWNYQDPGVREKKVRELHRYTAVADQLELPILAGTEMNKSGQKFVDDYSAAPIRQIAGSLLRGAQIMIGHTRLLRYADFSYTDDRTAREFPGRRQRNDFFAAVGRLAVPPPAIHQMLTEMKPEHALARLHDAASSGQWPGKGEEI